MTFGVDVAFTILINMNTLFVGIFSNDKEKGNYINLKIGAVARVLSCRINYCALCSNAKK